MPTDKTAAETILAQVAAVSDARMRPMFGEYTIYVDEKVIGVIGDGTLFVKATEFGVDYAPELETAAPYPGAKLALVVPPEKRENSLWLREFLAGTRRQLK